MNKKKEERVDIPRSLRFSHLYISIEPPLSEQMLTFSFQIIFGKRSKRSTTVANPSRSHPPRLLPDFLSPSPFPFAEPSPSFLSEDRIAFDSGSQRYEKDQDSFLYTSWLKAK
ncbi:uncharacterized protein TNCV_815831 [Trichonephila clavipes]|nr:uncharacterized protein TNCV_815831 [Trichonephila clavipes]